MELNNSYTPIVNENEWCAKYPNVDREYVWSYPLIHGPEKFNPADIFRKTDVPLPSKDVVVYIHVPACLFRCPMCPFYVELVKSRDELIDYADAIIKELKMYQKSELLGELNLKTIYFGGGTAALLYPDAIGRIIKAVKAIIPHKQEVEITVEGHSSVVDYEYLHQIHENGANRVSFGVQSFDDNSLKVLGLKQRSVDNYKALENSMKVGFNTVAADFLYRTPGQTVDSLKKQLNLFFDTGVTSISAYSLELSVRQGELSKLQPSEEVDKKMFYAINDEMNKRGWNHTAQPDYSHPDHIQQETLVTWKAPQGQTIGLGAGACSSFNGVNYYNVHNIGEYMKVVGNNCLPVLSGQKFTIEDAMSRYMVLGTRCFKISGKEFKNIFGKNMIQIYGPEIRRLESQGLIVRKDEDIEVTRKGKYYVDNISKAFYSLGNRCHLQPWGEKMKGDVAESYLDINSL